MSKSPFPDFYIIGAAKAGTTSLVDMLRAHEQAWFPHEKEPHHFFLRDDSRAWTLRDGSREKPLASLLPYGSESAYLGLYRDAPEEALRGDASTQYLVNDTTAKSIHAQRPDAKIVVVLRHPTDRAYSAWVHARSRGEDALASFDEAIGECENGLRDTAFATNYLAEGDYARHLKPYQDLFGDNLLVILFEDLIQKPQAVYDRLTTFLGIEQRSLPDNSASHKNASIELANPVARAFRMTAKRLRRMAPGIFELPLFRKPYEALLAKMGRKPEKLSPEMRKRLDAYYTPHIAKLEASLGSDLPGWHR
ncbi:sulfotransferase domain-containing protein [Qipengyuania sp. 1NDH17]|uniref:Sulfotransferase domain-containing protein n=1 Tax=Qipengyuania polymorpha TaxID=2867234 RepID=A0ABS7IUY0_9SPHN|nr:sulfotransferase domain-containing protein [Qipengyuania polymorpha]